MYARSTTVHGKPAALDVGIAYVREAVMPTVREMAGCMGLSMLTDRHSGRSVITSSWTALAAMHASDEYMKDARRRIADILVGPLEVQEWEIAVLHRRRGTRKGARTRVAWTAGDPAQLDRAIGDFRGFLLPRLDELPGFCNLSLFVDRTTGRTATAMSYENPRAVDAAAEAAERLHRQLVERAGMQVEDVASFDLVLAHLRVPETV
jgi:quinol monooxygenase YgiN